MPFKSEKQRRYMYAKHPAIAKRWTEKYGSEVESMAELGKRKRTSKKGKR